MKKALITGICGFSGGYLAKYLLEQRILVYGIDAKSVFKPPHDHLVSKIKFTRFDLLKGKLLRQFVRRIKPDYVFHLAALIGEHKLESLMRVNVLGTKNILEAAGAVKARVLISGSAAEYGLVSKNDLPINEATLPRPVNYYGISKLAQTMLGYKYYIDKNVKVYLTRVFNMTGPGELTRMVLASFAHQIKMIRAQKIKPIIYVGNLTPRRDFIDVRDVVRAYWLVVNKGTSGQIYNICSGQAHSIKNVLSMLLKVSGVNNVIIKQPVAIRRLNDIPIQIGDNRRINKDTGWKPQIKFARSLEEILQFASKSVTL